MESKKKISMDEDGSWYMEEVRRWPVPGVEADIQKEAMKTGILIPTMAPHTYAHYRIGSVVVLRELQGINFKCAWSAMLDPKKDTVAIYPAFKDPHSVKLADAFLWKCPSDMLLFAAAQLSTNSMHAATSMLKMGMFAVKKGTKNMYRLPLPNIHEDGMLCTGTLPPIQVNMGIDLIMKTLWDAFLNNDWNTDLLHGEMYKKMFRLDKKGETLEPDGKWETLCGAPISNPTFNDSIGVVLQMYEKGASK